VSQEECARIREGVTYIKVYRYNPKHLCPNWNGYGDNGQRKEIFSAVNIPPTALSVVSYDAISAGGGQ